ncbi:MAG: 50S ribosomal protein L9 [Syntrophaceae bacterium PtaU1.Bin231]|nr:MAG: 50S ribosomal protein L9 [Syntrophaceae bacterium PtaU1.Bin231]HOG18050.1 50S ribosomal protein L9 [Syntrophales bacterium]
MKVILKQDVESLGKTGDIVKVADGHARNFLIPRGLAMEANVKSIRAVEHDKALILRKAAKEKEKAEALRDRLAGVNLTISRRSGEQDKLFGSVGAKDIEQALKDQGIEIDRKDIVLEEPIKTVGEFAVKVKLSQGVTGELKVTVAAEA